MQDVLEGSGENDPEAMALAREIAESLQEAGSEIFSDFEWKVWSEKLKGHDYQEIAEILQRPPKSIDNALQRIKKKILAYLEE